jgi:hypothetical protein
LLAIAYPASSLLILVFALPHRLKTPKKIVLHNPISPKLTQKSASNTHKQALNYEKRIKPS